MLSNVLHLNPKNLPRSILFIDLHTDYIFCTLLRSVFVRTVLIIFACAKLTRITISFAFVAKYMNKYISMDVVSTSKILANACCYSERVCLLDLQPFKVHFVDHRRRQK